MKPLRGSRRAFIAAAAGMVGTVATKARLGTISSLFCKGANGIEFVPTERAADYTLRIGAAALEIGKSRIVSAVAYNGQFPGPLLRVKEGQPVVVDVHNDSDTPEQLHWHGQFVSTDVDGAAEEGTPYIPARGSRTVSFTPKPSGLRYYHTHNRAGADLHAGQYSGQVGPAYIEPTDNPGR